MSNFSRRARLCEVRSAMVRIHSFRRYFDAWGREREGGEQKVERNPIISLAGCHVGAAVTWQVFSFITYESEAFFLPVRPWDQTGFHRRSAVTEYTPIPKSPSPSRDVFFFFFRTREKSIFSDRFMESILTRQTKLKLLLIALFKYLHF